MSATSSGLSLMSGTHSFAAQQTTNRAMRAFKATVFMRIHSVYNTDTLYRREILVNSKTKHTSERRNSRPIQISTLSHTDERILYRLHNE